ncbi:MAG: hypothetical protein PHG66_04795 [Candidatus Colwellbacteria bacterium]|nr:hypothetical protein [Candidatus Colwellbacteria bacterium]
MNPINPIASVSWINFAAEIAPQIVYGVDFKYLALRGVPINPKNQTVSNRQPTLYPRVNFIPEGESAKDAVNAVYRLKGGKNGVGMKKGYAYLPSDSEEEKKRKSKAKKAFIKSHTDIQKVKAEKLFTGKTKNTRVNQPTQKGASVRYNPVSRQ